MRIYLLPGLGADKRMYERQIKILPEAIVIEHLPPVKAQTLAQYAKRIAALIDTSQPFILIGTSLGGMVAIELTQLLKPEKVILMASIKSLDEMPVLFRSMKYLRLHRLIPGSFYKKMNSLMIKRLDGRGDAEAARVIRSMMETTQPEFIDWAINAVVNWNPPKNIPVQVIHLHGTADQLFPISKIKNVIAVKNGSHVMNITKSEEVNALLLEAVRPYGSKKNIIQSDVDL
jgi:pimeloyl-ACP methyl ester carboxylesterase